MRKKTEEMGIDEEKIEAAVDEEDPIKSLRELIFSEVKAVRAHPLLGLAQRPVTRQEWERAWLGANPKPAA